MLKSDKSEIELFDLQEDPRAAARAAGLRYVTDSQPGWTRKKRGDRFSYWDAQGQIIKNANDLKRIQALVLPPAWKDVWICAHANGHLQATGRDARGRKQYRYHADWNKLRNETKFSKMTLFARKLPLIRKRVKKDLAQPGMGRDKVLAAIVQIMDQTMIRIGNDEYAEKNSSYGLTTLRNHHVKVQGPKIKFRFKGKSGQLHDVEIEDRKLAQIVRHCQDLPGQELFCYEADDGSYVDVISDDVNNYLQEITGEHITAKDFRTWGGTVQAAVVLQGLGPCRHKKDLKKIFVQAVQQTASHLRNTPAVCRKYYIHPCVFEAYESGQLFKICTNCAKTKSKLDHGLYTEEIWAKKLLHST